MKVNYFSNTLQSLNQKFNEIIMNTLNNKDAINSMFVELFTFVLIFPLFNVLQDSRPFNSRPVTTFTHEVNIFEGINFTHHFLMK
jgi:hypothetical protein